MMTSSRSKWRCGRGEVARCRERRRAGRCGRDRAGPARAAAAAGRARPRLPRIIEAAGGDHDDGPAWAVRGDGEAVREAARQEHQAAGPGLPGLVAAEPGEVAVEDEERLVAVVMDVRWRREPGRHPVIDDAQ